MNALSSMNTIISGIMAIMVTVVSWKALRDHATLNNPIISACVGGLVFAGLLTLPEKWQNAILLLYVSMALAFLFLLLWMASQKVRQSRILSNLSKMIEKQRYRARDQSRLNNQADDRRD